MGAAALCVCVCVCVYQTVAAIWYTTADLLVGILDDIGVVWYASEAWYTKQVGS